MCIVLFLFMLIVEQYQYIFCTLWSFRFILYNSCNLVEIKNLQKIAKHITISEVNFAFHLPCTYYVLYGPTSHNYSHQNLMPIPNSISLQKPIIQFDWLSVFKLICLTTSWWTWCVWVFFLKTVCVIFADRKSEMADITGQSQFYHGKIWGKWIEIFFLRNCKLY